MERSARAIRNSIGIVDMSRIMSFSSPNFGKRSVFVGKLVRE
jgi:hypothetical protein